MERQETGGDVTCPREFDVLMARLQRVERRQRMTLIGWALSLTCLVVLGAGVHPAGSQSSVIRASEFDVVDASGRDVIAIGLDAEGMAGLRVYDQRKQPRLAVGFSGSGPSASFGITLYNKQAKVQIGFDQLELPGIWYYDLTGAKRSQLGFGGTDPGLWFYDTGGKVTYNAP